MPPIKIALLGTGIFAREAHVPALKALSDLFEIAAVYSRRAENAAALAAELPGSPAVYTELDALLQRPDIEAVDVVLAIAVQPGVVEAALRAGKHVISEKPMAPDVATGRRLLETADRLTAENGRVWMVAENWRYEEAFRAAAQAVHGGQLGRPLQFSWTISNALTPEISYYNTAWRRDNSFPGGFLLDGGVHNIAAMRRVMGEVESVSAYVAQVRPDLPPADTLSANLRFESGAFGTFARTFAAGSGWTSRMRVTGDRGALQVDSGLLELSVGGTTSSQAFGGDAIRAELADFGRTLREGGAVVDGSPRQALQDVAIIEAMLLSARTGASVRPERVV